MDIYESNTDQLESVCQDLDVKASAIKNIYMPRAIRRLKLTIAAKVVMVELLDRCNINTMRCDLSQGEMAKQLKIGERTIRRAIKELEAKQVIVVIRAPSLSRISNKYLINWDLVRDKTLWAMKKDGGQEAKMASIRGQNGPVGGQNGPVGGQNDPNTRPKWPHDGGQNGTQTIEGTRELTRESNKRNEQLLTRASSPPHGSALDVDLTSDSEFDALVVIDSTSNGSDFSYKNQKARPTNRRSASLVRKNRQMRPSNAVRTVWDAEAIDISHLGFRPIQKIATIHASSGSFGESR